MHDVASMPCGLVRAIHGMSLTVVQPPMQHCCVERARRATLTPQQLHPSHESLSAIYVFNKSHTIPSESQLPAKLKREGRWGVET